MQFRAECFESQGKDASKAKSETETEEFESEWVSRRNNQHGFRHAERLSATLLCTRSNAKARTLTRS
jgi:hypothetical protein